MDSSLLDNQFVVGLTLGIMIGITLAVVFRPATDWVADFFADLREWGLAVCTAVGAVAIVVGALAWWQGWWF